MYFTSRRPQHQSLSQEDQSLASSLSHDINGHMSTLSPPITNGQAQTFGMGGHSGLSQTPSHPPGGPSTAGQHSGTDPNQDLSYGMGTDRRKRSKVSRACDECRRKKVSFADTGIPDSGLMNRTGTMRLKFIGRQRDRNMLQLPSHENDLPVRTGTYEERTEQRVYCRLSMYLMLMLAGISRSLRNVSSRSSPTWGYQRAFVRLLTRARRPTLIPTSRTLPPNLCLAARNAPSPKSMVGILLRSLRAPAGIKWQALADTASVRGYMVDMAALLSLQINSFQISRQRPVHYPSI